MKFGRGAGHEVPLRVAEPENPLIGMQREMRPGEKLIWADRPTSLRSHRRQHLATALFGIPYLAFSLFWTAAASGLLFGSGTGSAIDFIFPMFGLPFIAVGLGLVLSPVWAGWKGARTVYALSDQRVIISEGGWSRAVKSWPLWDVEKVVRMDRGVDGDIIVAESWIRGSRGGYLQKHGFLGIADAARVEHALLAAREALQERRRAERDTR